MEPAKDKSFRKTFKKPPHGNFINEEELGPELTEDNCTPELWKELTSDDDPFEIQPPESDDSKSL